MGEGGYGFVGRGAASWCTRAQSSVLLDAAGGTQCGLNHVDWAAPLSFACRSQLFFCNLHRIQVSHCFRSHCADFLGEIFCGGQVLEHGKCCS